jgi:hypothetical protein
MMREEVEFLHDGQAEQQRLHAALPQQQASWRERISFTIKLQLTLKELN